MALSQLYTYVLLLLLAFILFPGYYGRKWKLLFLRIFLLLRYSCLINFIRHCWLYRMAFRRCSVLGIVRWNWVLQSIKLINLLRETNIVIVKKIWAKNLPHKKLNTCIKQVKYIASLAEWFIRKYYGESDNLMTLNVTF